MVDLEREFQSPSSGFRGVPFWAWNGKLEKDTLQEQVSVFQKMGFGGFHIHVRTGLDDQYLGTEYMEAVSTVVEKAKECKGKPTMIVANTVKGKGVDFMENVCGFHGVAPTEEETKRAIEQLEKTSSI